MLEVLIVTGMTHVSIEGDNDIYGRSWEMACVMWCVGGREVYTGEITGYAYPVVKFGPVQFMDSKKHIASRVKTYKEIQSVTLPRG